MTDPSPPHPHPAEQFLPTMHARCKGFLKYAGCLLVLPALTIVATLALLRFYPDCIMPAQHKGLTNLNHTVDSVQNRLEGLENREQETREMARQASSAGEEKISALERQVMNFNEQLRTLPVQPEATALPENLKNYENQVALLKEGQKSIKAIILFWKLKEKILSLAPFQDELENFRQVMAVEADLAIFEKYAVQGIGQVTPSSQELSPVPPEAGDARQTDWLTGLKAKLGSVVKVQKLNNSGHLPPPSLPPEDKEAVMRLLTELDQQLQESLLQSSPAPENQPLASKDQAS